MQNISSLFSTCTFNTKDHLPWLTPAWFYQSNHHARWEQRWNHDFLDNMAVGKIEVRVTTCHLNLMGNQYHVSLGELIIRYIECAVMKTWWKPYESMKTPQTAREKDAIIRYTVISMLQKPPIDCSLIIFPIRVTIFFWHVSIHSHTL